MTHQCCWLVDSAKPKQPSVQGQSGLAVALPMLKVVGKAVGMETARAKQGRPPDGKIDPENKSRIDNDLTIPKIEQTQPRAHAAPVRRGGPKACQPRGRRCLVVCQNGPAHQLNRRVLERMHYRIKPTWIGLDIVVDKD